ncbi:vitamin K epoxide reductase, partial [Bacteroides uniformis]
LKEAKITQGEFDIEKLIVAQEEWCLNHKIYTTPTIFINGYKLPNYFSIKDIDYLY